MLSNVFCEVILQIHLVHISTRLILVGRVAATGMKKLFTPPHANVQIFVSASPSCIRRVVRIWVVQPREHVVRLESRCL